MKIKIILTLVVGVCTLHFQNVMSSDEHYYQHLREKQQQRDQASASQAIGEAAFIAANLPVVEQARQVAQKHKLRDLFLALHSGPANVVGLKEDYLFRGGLTPADRNALLKVRNAAISAKYDGYRSLVGRINNLLELPSHNYDIHAEGN